MTDPAQPDDSGSTTEPTAPASLPASASQTQPTGAARWWSAILVPFRWIGVPLRYCMRPFVFRVSDDGNKVTFTSYSALIYTWILIPAGLIAYLLGSWGWASPVALGWFQMGSIIVLLILLGDDMGLWAVVVTAMIAALLTMAAYFAKAEYDIPVLGWVRSQLVAMDVQYSPGLALGLALFGALIISFYVLPKAWFVGRYEITTREVTHIRRGVAVESWRRAGRDVKQRWPDMLESLVGIGSGSVALLDRQQKAVMTIPNVICLWYYRREVERVLEKIATSDFDDEDAIDEMD